MVGLSSLNKQDDNNSIEKVVETIKKPKLTFKSVMITTLRYLLCIPIGWIVGWLALKIIELLWSFWNFVSTPFFDFVNIEILNRIDEAIEWFIYTSTSIPISYLLMFATTYYILPKNKARKIIFGIYSFWFVAGLIFNAINNTNGIISFIEQAIILLSAIGISVAFCIKQED